MDKVVALIDSALKLAVEIQVGLPILDIVKVLIMSAKTFWQRCQVFKSCKYIPQLGRVKAISSSFKLFKLGRLDTYDAQASSGPKLVDFKAALVKPENEVDLYCWFFTLSLSAILTGMVFINGISIYIDFASDEADCSEKWGGIICSEV